MNKLSASGGTRGFGRMLPGFLMWVLAFYIAFIFYTSRSCILAGISGTIAALCLTVFFAIAIREILKYVFYRLNALNVPVPEKREGLSFRPFAAAGGFSFLFLLVFYISEYPGGISFDNINQWEQVLRFDFVDWHPAFHTILIWLVSRIRETYSFVILVQIIVFSLGVGYLMAVLSAWGIKKGWLTGLLLLLLFNHNTIAILQFALKDSAFSIAVLFLAVCCIEIVLSRAEWLGGKRNLLFFSICLAMVSLIRHNGILLTVPLLFLTAACFSSRRLSVLYAAAVSLGLVMFVKFPLYQIFDVTVIPHQSHVESVGLPMTILGDIKVLKPEVLDDEANELLRRIAPDEMWAESYELHNYNSIKWYTDANEVLRTVKIPELLHMTIQAVKQEPGIAFSAVLGLTDMVWRIGKTHPDERITVWRDSEAIDGLNGSPSNSSLGTVQELCSKITAPINRLLYSQLIETITSLIGLQILLLLFFGMFSVLYRRNLAALILVVPVMVYNFGTMVLLCGHDYRFFHFNLLITLPYVMVCLVRQRDDISETVSPE